MTSTRISNQPPTLSVKKSSKPTRSELYGAYFCQNRNLDFPYKKKYNKKLSFHLAMRFIAEFLDKADKKGSLNEKADSLARFILESSKDITDDKEKLENEFKTIIVGLDFDNVSKADLYYFFQHLFILTKNENSSFVLRRGGTRSAFQLLRALHMRSQSLLLKSIPNYKDTYIWLRSLAIPNIYCSFFSSFIYKGYLKSYKVIQKASEKSLLEFVCSIEKTHESLGYKPSSSFLIKKFIHEFNFLDYEERALLLFNLFKIACEKDLIEKDFIEQNKSDMVYLTKIFFTWLKTYGGGRFNQEQINSLNNELNMHGMASVSLNFASIDKKIKAFFVEMESQNTSKEPELYSKNLVRLIDSLRSKCSNMSQKMCLTFFIFLRLNTHFLQYLHFISYPNKKLFQQRVLDYFKSWLNYIVPINITNDEIDLMGTLDWEILFPKNVKNKDYYVDESKDKTFPNFAPFFQKVFSQVSGNSYDASSKKGHHPVASSEIGFKPIKGFIDGKFEIEIGGIAYQFENDSAFQKNLYEFNIGIFKEKETYCRLFSVPRLACNESSESKDSGNSFAIKSKQLKTHSQVGDVTDSNDESLNDQNGDQFEINKMETISGGEQIEGQPQDSLFSKKAPEMKAKVSDSDFPSGINSKKIDEALANKFTVDGQGFGAEKVESKLTRDQIDKALANVKIFHDEVMKILAPVTELSKEPPCNGETFLDVYINSYTQHIYDYLPSVLFYLGLFFITSDEALNIDSVNSGEEEKRLKIKNSCNFYQDVFFVFFPPLSTALNNAAEAYINARDLLIDKYFDDLRIYFFIREGITVSAQLLKKNVFVGFRTVPLLVELSKQIFDSHPECTEWSPPDVDRCPEDLKPLISNLLPSNYKKQEKNSPSLDDS